MGSVLTWPSARQVDESMLETFNPFVKEVPIIKSSPLICRANQ